MMNEFETVVNIMVMANHVLEGRRSQGGLTPNSLQFYLFGAFRCLNFHVRLLLKV